MNIDLATWHHGLLFGSLCALLGFGGFVSAGTAEDRRLLHSTFLQGVLLIFVVAGSYFRESNLYFGGLALVGLLLIETLHSSLHPANNKADLPNTKLADKDQSV